jgi:hypothetical protein
MAAAACSENNRYATRSPLPFPAVELMASRTRGFYYIYSCFTFAKLTGPLISAWSMQLSLWLAIAIGAILLVISFPLLAAMPNTPRNHDFESSQVDEMDSGFGTRPQEHSVLYALFVAMTHQFSMLKIIFANRNMLLSVPIFMVGTFRGITERILIQYTSVRFKWKLAQVLLFELETKTTH